jgi:hypothetical protein
LSGEWFHPYLLQVPIRSYFIRAKDNLDDAALDAVPCAVARGGWPLRHAHARSGAHVRTRS